MHNHGINLKCFTLVLPLWLVWTIKIVFERYYKKHVEDSKDEDGKHNQDEVETQAIDVEERI